MTELLSTGVRRVGKLGHTPQAQYIYGRKIKEIYYMYIYIYISTYRDWGSIVVKALRY